MSLDKAIKHNKEKRKPYRGSKAIDSTCRNHGSCPWCTGNRLHKFRDKHPLDDDEEYGEIKEVKMKIKNYDEILEQLAEENETERGLTMEFLKIDEELFDRLLHKAVAEKCEISIEVTPESENVTIRPWKPFSYNCPYNTRLYEGRDND